MLSPIEDIIAEARAGRPFILVDEEDRENEGDVIIPAQFASAEQINFMAMHARGLICVAISAARAKHLRLAPMVSANGSRHSTAFTVSVEAREGITTGISAHDRARTVAVVTDKACGAADLTSPGHVFPLVARDGGVLVRAGHTEAAVDVARLAGCDPAGVICEIMNEDGTMARLPELKLFAARHGLKIGTIADLIEYRRRTERSVERVTEAPFRSADGHDFTMVIYRNLLDGKEHVALVKGQPSGDTTALVRVHSIDLATDLFRHAGDRADYIPRAMAAIGDHDGPGVMVFLRNADMSWSQHYRAGLDEEGPDLTLREYGLGAQILRDLGVREMINLSTRTLRINSLEGFGLKLVETRSLDDASGRVAKAVASAAA